MGGVRRSAVGAAAALAALLLLLLARQPPPAPARPPPLSLRPRTVAGAALSTTTTSTTTTTTTTTTTAAPTAAVAPLNRTSAPPAPKVIVAADLYEAGHERAHPELCPSLGANLKLLVAITSAPGHRAARDAIRLTWGHFGRRADVAVAFAVGAPPPALRASLLAEDALYGDLVLGRSVDTYSNMTLKTLSILEWADTYCPRARRLLKTDDDMFVNVPRLLDFAAANASRTVWGKVVRKSLPKRTPRSKYYVPPAQFPGRVFPDFATGPAYLVTADAVRPLLREALRTRYLRLEDVFLTGVVADRLGIRRVHAAEFHNRKLSPTACALRKSISLHMVRYHEQFDLWRKLMDGTAKCP